MELYRHYKNGLLPVSGGLMDQAAGYIEAMHYIDRLMTNGNPTR